MCNSTIGLGTIKSYTNYTLRVHIFFLKTALVITVTENLLLKRRFGSKMCFPSLSVNTVLVIAVTLNLLPKRRSWPKTSLVPVCVKTAFLGPKWSSFDQTNVAKMHFALKTSFWHSMLKNSKD